MSVHYTTVMRMAGKLKGQAMLLDATISYLLEDPHATRADKQQVVDDLRAAARTIEITLTKFRGVPLPSTHYIAGDDDGYQD